MSHSSVELSLVVVLLILSMHFHVQLLTDMPIIIFSVPSRLQTQHEANLSIARSFSENKVKVDPLRDPKKSDIESLDWSCNGDKILVCSRDGVLKMWRADRLMEERAWQGSWTCVEAHPSDANIFASVSWDGKLKVVDIRTPSNAIEIDLKKSKGDSFDKLLHVTWALDGKSLAIISRNDFVHTYDIDSGAVHTIQPGCEVYGALFDTQDRLWLATGGSPGKMLIYPPSDSSAPPVEIVAHSHITACMTRSRDNHAIATGGSDALVALWDSHTASCLRTFPKSLAPVTCVSVNFDRTLIAWGSGAIGNRDGESVLSIAGLETGVHYVSYQTAAPVTRIKWHPSSNVIAYSVQLFASVDSCINIITFPSGE